MPASYYHSNTDKNHVAIKTGLQQDYKTYDLRRAGDGVPDLLVLSKKNVWVLLEVKMPGNGLRGKEIDFFRETIGAPRHVVETLAEARDIMKQYD